MKSLKRFLLLLLSPIFCATALAQINRVEPLNWWVGMKNPHVQLLINGNGIAETTPVIEYEGVAIKKVTKGDSKHYLFVDLQIAPQTKAGSFIIRFTKNGSEVYRHLYALKNREQPAAAFEGFNSKDAIYLIVPDRFANGDYNNDVVAGMKEDKIDRRFPGGRHGGDIRGIINHLDYIHDMGFTAIWPTPMLENDMPAYSYHGYAITNHYKVDPRFGSLADYKELSAKMRQKGMKLIFDEVLNHTGSHYWWMNDLPFKNWLNFPEKYTATNHRRTVNQDMYASQFDKDLWSKGWFDKTMPDLNGQNPFLAAYLIQSTIWWIETLQLGGIRQDTYGYSDKTFLKNWSCAIMHEYPNFSIVGEEWSTNPLITSYWQSPKKNHDGYSGCVNTAMDFPLQEALVKALTEPEGAYDGKGFTKLYEALANDFVYPQPNQLLLLADNHDMDRLFMQLKQDVALTKMALTYLLTIRGIPQLFYGTEILMDNSPQHKNDGLIRADFPGGWKEDSVSAFSGAGLHANQLAMQALVKHLLHWRKNNAVIANGKTLHFAPFDGIYVYCRYNQQKTIVVVMNKNDKAMTLETSRFAEIIKDKTKALEIVTNKTVDLKTGMVVPPKSASVFELQ